MKNDHKFNQRYGPWAVVTGASSGIGRGLALKLAARGMDLVLVARSTEALKSLSDQIIAEYKVNCRVVTVDLSTYSGIVPLATATAGLDIGLLVASAGFGTSGAFLENSIESELQMLDVNCKSLLALTWHFGRLFARRGRGGIILLSSIVGFQGMPWASNYAATKAYVQTLAEGLRVELKPRGVDILAAAPGPTNSGFASRAGMKMGAALDADDVAEPILNSLGRQTTVLPGMLSKVLVYALVGLPRWARVQIMGKVMAGMTSHRRSAVAGSS